MTENVVYWDIKPYLKQSIQINITAILIQRILVFQAKFLLFMTLLTNIEPYYMFYIIRRNVTLKIDRTWKVSLFSCYLNSIISTLFRI